MLLFVFYDLFGIYGFQRVFLQVQLGAYWFWRYEMLGQC